MRHVITVVCSREQLENPAPRIEPRDGETQRDVKWFACRDQDNPVNLLDDSGSFLLKMLRAPVLAYALYQLVHSTKLWSGKRPLVLVRGRSFGSRVTAWAGRWGGGDVVMPAETGGGPLGPTRFLLAPDGRLLLRSGDEAG